MLDFLTTISWSDPTTIGSIIGIVALVAVAGYLYWAWSDKSWPFGQ